MECQSVGELRAARIHLEDALHRARCREAHALHAVLTDKIATESADLAKAASALRFGIVVGAKTAAAWAALHTRRLINWLYL